MIRKFLLTLALGCLVSTAQANDSAVAGVGGSLQPLKGEHPQVRMVRETVRLDIYRDYYDVLVRFVFHNDGPATVTGMGFPEGAYGDVADSETHTAFKDFSSTVDGKRVAVQRMPVKVEEGSEDYSTLWVKKVPFKKGQTRNIEVKYRAPVGMSAGMGINRFAAYEFTGGNWKGKVDRSDLICVFHAKGTTIAGSYFGDGTLPMRRVGETYTFSFRNWEAQGSFLFRFMNTLPGWMLISEDSMPLSSWGTDKYFTYEAKPPLAASIPDSQLDLRPPAFREKGIVYVSLNDLRDKLAFQANASERREEVEVAWQKSGVTTLRLNKRVFTFKPGQAFFTDSSQKGPVKLPVAPQVAGGRLYIPLEAIAHALSGRVTLAAPQEGRVRRLELSIPPFWNGTGH